VHFRQLEGSGIDVLKTDMFVSSLIRTAETAGLMKHHIDIPELKEARLWAVPYLLEEPASVLWRGNDNTPEAQKDQYDKRLKIFSQNVGIGDIQLNGVLVHKSNTDKTGWDLLVHKDTHITWRSIADKFKKRSLPLNVYKKAKEKIKAGVYAVIAFTHGGTARSMLGLSNNEKDCLGNGGIGIAAYDVDVNSDTEPQLRGPHGYIFSGGEAKMRPKKDRKWAWFIENKYFRYDGFATCAAGSCKSFIQKLGLHQSESQCTPSSNVQDGTWKEYTIYRSHCRPFEFAADG